jgi:hypothetical protein
MTRGLDLESTPALLTMLARGLRGISNRLTALALEAPPDLGDAIGFAASDLDRQLAIVEVLVTRPILTPKTKVRT